MDFLVKFLYHLLDVSSTFNLRPSTYHHLYLRVRQMVPIEFI